MKQPRRQAGLGPDASAAAPAMNVHLLGAAHASIDGSDIPFGHDKRFQLLSYLAFRAEWVRRDALAGLFYPDLDPSAGRHALRQLLKRTRALDWLRQLDVSTHSLRWTAGTDVAAFLLAVREEAWGTAVRLYGGPLLQGMERSLDGEMAEWLEAERHQLRARWQAASFEHARVSSEDGDLVTAQATLLALTQDDPLDEEALRAYMVALAQGGLHDRAIRAHRAFSAHLESELGIHPTTATEQLAEDVARDSTTGGRRSRRTPGAVAALAGAGSAVDSLSAPTTSFVGRSRELAELHRLLSDPYARLVTITGLGGAGKSRLAREVAAREAARFPDGVLYVALEHVSASELVPHAIAAAIGIEIRTTDPVSRVIGRVGDGRALLVIDNFEHLTAAATVLTSLLEACNGLKLLVTSRVPLALEGEWLVPLDGLDLPTEAASNQDALASDAVQLLVQRGRRVAPRLTLDAALLPHALRICRLVGGLPLAIEMATVWARTLPLAHIAEELARDLDLLVAKTTDADRRHASVRAIFEQSWRQLGETERNALASLAVFEGGFSSDAAAVMADVGNAVVGSLVDKSLLQVRGGGRYDLHPLVRQYAREKLAEGPSSAERAQSAADAHARYYLALAERSGASASEAAVAQAAEPGAAQRASVLGPDLANLQAALKHLAERREHGRQLRLAVELATYYRLRGPYEVGAAMLEDALEITGPGSPSSPSSAAIIRGFLLAGDLAERCAKPDRAEDRFEQARLLALGAADHEAEITAVLGLARLRLARHADASEAEALVRHALRSARRHGNPRQEAASLFLLSTVERETGRMSESIESLTEAHRSYQELDDVVGAANAMKNLGNRHLDRGEIPLAKAWYGRALEAYESATHLQGKAMALSCLGLVATREGEVAQAKRLHNESIAIYRSLGDKRLLAPALAFLAGALLAAEEYGASRRLLEESLALQLEVGDNRHQADVLRSLGDLSVLDSDERAAGFYLKSLDLSREVGDAWGEAHSLVALAGCALDDGALRQARRNALDALAMSWEMKLAAVAASALELLAQVEFHQGSATKAGRAARAAQHMTTSIGTDDSAIGRLRHQRFLARMADLTDADLEQLDSRGAEAVVRELLQEYARDRGGPDGRTG